MPARQCASGIAVAIATLLATPLFAADSESERDPSIVSLRGQVVCWSDPASGEAADAGADDDPCDRVGARYGLWVSPSESVHFLAEDARAAIFADPAVRDREIEVRGWRRPGGGLEILSVHSIRDGKPHRLHYRCDVCNITATAPGPCWCCGAPFELREEPVPPTTDADSGPR
jgi:hypothetical protein